MRVSSLPPNAEPQPDEPAVLLSSEELTAILVHTGARLVSRHEHGDLLAAHHHLVHVPTARFVGSGALRDVLAQANLTPARCRELLAQLRAGTLAQRTR